MTSRTRGPLRVVVLVSGRGSNLQAIAARAAAGALQVEIAAVVSDRADAGALAWANAHGVPVAVLKPSDFPDRAAYGRALAELVQGYQPGLVVLAGFMRILNDEFVQRFSGRLLNIHPSLLPSHPGLHTHRRALAAGDREHGASVHFVTAELDGGPVVIQAKVPILTDDDEATLAERVLRQEHEIYPQCVGWFADGRLELRDGVVWFDGRRMDAPMIFRANDTNQGTS